MLHKFSTKPQHLFNFWCLSFVLPTKCTFPPLTVRPLIRRTACGWWVQGSLLGQGALLLTCCVIHVAHPNAGLGSALRQGWDGDAGLTWRTCPIWFSHICLVDVTKYFSHKTIDPINTHGMKAPLALIQEGVFISQHHSSIFNQANTCNKPNLMYVRLIVFRAVL